MKQMDTGLKFLWQVHLIPRRTFLLIGSSKKHLGFGLLNTSRALGMCEGNSLYETF